MVLRKHLIIGHFSFSLFFTGTIQVVNLPEQTETGLITLSDQTMQGGGGGGGGGGRHA